VPRVEAERELLAERDDVWAFLAEPHHFPDWWPGVQAVQPDRRALSPGARWHVRRTGRPTLFRRARASELLLVREVAAPSFVAFHLTGDRLDVELALEPAGSGRTLARLTISGPWLVGLGRSLPRNALGRLHALCQTAAQL
jgi:uncharacterized protein YndB with AHSA1/START domain